MDSTLRPKAAAKRLKPKLNSPITGKKPSKSASFIKTHPEQLVTAARKSSTKRSVPPEPELESEGSDVPAAPAWSQLQNPYLNRTSLNWVELQDLDHCVYLLQKGAPLHGKTIPQSWNRVKKVLFDDGLITLDELRSREATEFLKSRYESVRLGLQNFFNSGPESIDKKDWTLFKSEGFDVYVMKRGKRYLKHHKDSLVEKTSSSFDGLSFSAGSVDHVTRDDEGTTLNNSSSKRPPASKADIVDLEDDGELGLITEIESNLVESIEEHPLSDAALEELLFPVEQYVMEESNRAFEFSASFLTHRDKALDQVNTVASEAGATDPATHDDLTRIMPHNTESSSLGIKVNPRIEFGTPQTPKVQNKTTKRRSRVGVPIAIHEDSPPQAKRIVRMKPASPGTDIPKENLDDLGSTSSVTLPYSSLFGGPVDPLSPVSSPTTG